LKALYYSPRATEPHLALAKIYNAENKPKNALVHLKAAYSNKTKDKEILEVYGETLFLADESSKSLEMYENLLELDPKNQKAKERIEILKNRLGIFELPSQFNAIPLSDAVTKEQMAAILDIKFKSIIESPPGKPPIIIDISTSWASKYIVKISSLGILDVYPNHTFQPKKIINRAEMTETISRLINILKKKGYRFIVQIPPEKIQISDISRDNFYYQPIIKLISYNLMSLSPGRKFNPDRPVSGQEAIKLLDIILALIK
jgi:tetratricopeptide (TPR) repeat protein